MRAVYQYKLGVTLHAGHWLLTSTIVFTLGAAVAPCTESSVYISTYMCLHVMGFTQTKMFNTFKSFQYISSNINTATIGAPSIFKVPPKMKSR